METEISEENVDTRGSVTKGSMQGRNKRSAHARRCANYNTQKLRAQRERIVSEKIDARVQPHRMSGVTDDESRIANAWLM
jgi:hypothetical protein